MSDTQVQAGMDWVETRLRALAEGQAGTINRHGWEADKVDVAARRGHFVLRLNGERQVVTFDHEDLEEVPSNRHTQIIVDAGLRAFLNDQLRGCDLVSSIVAQDG